MCSSLGLWLLMMSEDINHDGHHVGLFAVKADSVQVSHFSYCKNDSYVLYTEATEGRKEIIEAPSIHQTKCS